MLFPLAVAIAYALVAVKDWEKAVSALAKSGHVLLQIAPALLIALGVMVVLNLFVKPALLKKTLGKGTKVRGSFLSSFAGILSMGSIYAWYPLLKELHEKGVSNFHLANFLGCRAVKIPLMPMMAAYFGWVFTGVISGAMILASLVTACVVNILAGKPAK